MILRRILINQSVSVYEIKIAILKIIRGYEKYCKVSYRSRYTIFSRFHTYKARIWLYSSVEACSHATNIINNNTGYRSRAPHSFALPELPRRVIKIIYGEIRIRRAFKSTSRRFARGIPLGPLYLLSSIPFRPSVQAYGLVD